MTEKIQQQIDRKLGHFTVLLYELENAYRWSEEARPLLQEAYALLSGPVIDWQKVRKRWLRKYHETFGEQTDTKGASQ